MSENHQLRIFMIMIISSSITDIMNFAHELGCFEENFMKINSITRSSLMIFS